jgi:serine protease
MRLLITLLVVLASTLSNDASQAAGARQQPVQSRSNDAPRIIFQRMAKNAVRGDIEILQLATDATPTDVRRALDRLKDRGDLLYAVQDQRRQPHAVPNDAIFPTQWFLQSTEVSAIDAVNAWDITTGGAGTVVAVLDTGVRFDHPDMQRAAQSGKLLPGFDFVSGENTTSFLAANDGDGWDTDPSDPGDWIDGVDQQRTLFNKCLIKNSSWHGTRVAGLIGAASNNGIGIAGVSWNALILPVRVLGKCGGYDADILPAMRWAAGLHVSGVPDNPFPAKILNLSFGSPGICNAAYQGVLQELSAIGVLVVISAGNEAGAVDAPANCPYALAVAGLRHAGTKVGYSSIGPEVALAAPAGNCVNTSGPCLFSLHTTYDVGTSIPVGSDYTNQFNTNLGTSFSAPLVAGVAALMHSVNGRLNATQLRTRLSESARPFPSNAALKDCPVPTNDPNQECNCTLSTCGAGMLSAPGAVIAAQRPIANIAAPVNFNAGSNITLDAAASTAACNRTLVSYAWSVISATGTSPPPLTRSDQSSVQLLAPLSGSYTLRLTVTDDRGATDIGDISIDSTSSINNTTAATDDAACPAAINTAQQLAPQTTIAEPTASSGGGGAVAWYWLTMLLGIALQKKKRSSG